MTNEQRIELMRERISKELNPTSLEIIDHSHQHIGHPGAQTGAGHFAVRVVSSAFAGKSRIQRHQMIYGLLDDMMVKEIHALSIDAQESE